jgi:hypothetical protein
LGDQIKKTEMGRACSLYGGEEERCSGLGWGSLGDPGIDGRMILKWIFKKWSGGHGLDPFVSE